MAKKLVASSALVGGALALTFSGAFASFTDTATAGPQTISSGTLTISTSGAPAGASGLAPGDWLYREITLTNTGSINLNNLNLAFTGSSLLDSDGTNGLQLSVQDCSQAPTTSGTPAVYSCGATGGFTTININGASSASVASLETAGGEPLTTLASLTAGQKDYLVFKLSLPSTAPGDPSQYSGGNCSGTAGGNDTNENLQGCTSTLTYKFIATQRNGQAQ